MKVSVVVLFLIVLLLAVALVRESNALVALKMEYFQHLNFNAIDDESRVCTPKETP